MAWIRLSDDYVDDEKMQALSDGAFRLWHEGLAHCRRHQTDGLIPFTVMRGLRSFTKSREKQLATACREGLAPLWELVPAMGYKVRNYLAWNPSKDEENERRAESKDRMRMLRERRTASGVPPNRQPSAQNVCANNLRSDANVLGRDRKEELKEELSLEERASRLRELFYPAWYRKYRNGAKLLIPLIANSLEFSDALSIVSTWDDARIEKLARIVLTTDDPFISNTDRGFKIFAMKATWADDRLREAEKARAS